MTIKRWAAGFLLVAGAAEACSTITGLDEFEVTSAAATTGVGGSGGSEPVAEICGNGADDDGDHHPDCVDPDCASAYTCVPQALEPVFLAQSDECAVPFTAPLDLIDCNTCECDATPGICHVSGTLYNAASCTGAGYTFSTTGCSDVSASGLSSPVFMALQVDYFSDSGSCSPAAVDPVMSVCQLDDAAGCVAGAQLCAPNNIGVSCVLVTGNQCPFEHMIARPIWTEPGACECGCYNDGEACPVGVTLYQSDNCDDPGVFTYGVDACVEVPAPVGSLKAPASEVWCAASSAPTTAPPKTLCCGF